MRRPFAPALVMLATLAPGTFGCRPPSSSSASSSVYVPGGEDGGSEVGAPVDSGEAGFGLGPIDRAGRPLVSVLLVPAPLQDGYNAQPTFEPQVPRVLEDGLESRLELLDRLSLDGGPGDPVDWPVPDGGSHPLLPVFASDILLVDTARSCVGRDGGFVSSYFEIEREVFLSGPTHRTCGGRTPSDRVVDSTLELLVTADRDGGTPVRQGVAGPTRPAAATFPYLAPPN